MKVIASIEPGEPPIKASLMFMMAGSVLREDTLAVRGDNGVEVGPKVRLGVLCEDGLRVAFAENGDLTGARVVFGAQGRGMYGGYEPGERRETEEQGDRAPPRGELSPVLVPLDQTSARNFLR